MRPSRFLCRWHAHRRRYNRRIETIQLGAFELSKGVSNCSELLETNNRDRLPIIIRDNAADSCILGNGISVRIHFNFSAILIQNLTLYQNKSYILSEVVRLLDPLGLLGPVIVISLSRKAHLAGLVVIGQPMGRVCSSGHPHSLDRRSNFQNTDE